MKIDELIDLLCDENNKEFDKILPQINIKEDSKDFLKLCSSFVKTELSIQFVDYLIKSGNGKILEENIQYVPSKAWRHLKDNEKFKTVFMNNFDKIAENHEKIDFSDIKDAIDKDEEEDFYKNNILKLIDVMKNEMVFFINHLINDTDFGEDLLIKNQEYLFGKLEYIWSLLDCLKNEFKIDIKIFLKGIVENFEYITKKEEIHFCQFLNIVKDMIEDSNLEEKEIEDIKEKIRGTIVKGKKLNSNLMMQLIRKNNYKAIECIRYFGVDKQILRKEQYILLNCLTGEKIIEYINGCKKYEGISEDYTFKKLIHQVFYSQRLIVNDEPTMYAIETLITEIAKAQRLEPFDIENAGQGGYSTNFKIGDFILKVGKVRATRKIPYHKRIMQPIIRQETDPNGINNLCIELQNVGDPNWYDNMSEEEIEEELYKIYSELRDDGIIWTDIKEENVVRLLRPNKLNFKLNGEEIGRNKDSVEMMNLKDEEPLGVGELVIADTDFLWYEKDFYEEGLMFTGGYPSIFNKRYEKEHEKPKEEIEFE